jgi:hypothetical protein
MTKDDITRMAREAGCVDPMVFFGAYERFAALVAAAERERVMNEPINKEHWQRFEDEIRAAEREACAKVCYELPWKDMDCIPSNLAFAAAIRARGNP